MYLTDNGLAFEVPVSAHVFPAREVRTLHGVVRVLPVAVLVDREGDTIAGEVRAVRVEVVLESILLLLLTARALEAAPPVVVAAPA